MPLGLFQRDEFAAQAPGVGEFGTSAPPQPGALRGLWDQSPFSSAVGEGALKVAQASGAGSADLFQAMSPNPDFFTTPDVVQIDPEELALHQRTEQQRVIDAFKMDPRRTGGAANLIHNVTAPLTEMALGTMATGGNPLGGAVAVGAGEGYATNQEMRLAGVDENTAKALAAGTALFSGAGALLPGGFGKTLLQRIATGAAAQTEIGAANRGMMSSVLAQAGYTEQAKAYVAFDGMAMLSDAVLGAGFGAVHHVFTPDVVDAARVVQDSVNVEHAAPGAPVDGASRQATIDNTQRAQDALIRGDDTAPPSDSVRTVPNPAQDAAREASATAVQDAAAEIGAERVEAPAGPTEAEVLARAKDLGLPTDVTTVTINGETRRAVSVGRPEPPKVEDPLAKLDPADREVLQHAETVLRDKPNSTFSEQLRQVIDDIKQSTGIGEELHKVAAACGWR